ncbi:MAG TPA: M13 family metallopeptidase [Terriglobales bacterium]|nr:M13 family metallopeptidase [Terriglobales bacterium]
MFRRPAIFSAGLLLCAAALFSLAPISGGSIFHTLAALAKSAPAASSEAGKSFDLSAIDRSADPCNDFYQFACGQWMKNNPIPSDQARWGRFNELVERNRLILRQILEEAAANPRRSAVYQKIGDYYGSCMDEDAIEKKGLAALKPRLDKIAAIKSRDEVPMVLAALHREGAHALFDMGADQDFKDATQIIAIVDQGGLGMPDRDYYLKEDARSVALRQGYLKHVQSVFGLMGEAPQQASADADAVMKIETALARDSMDRVKRREPQNVYHKMSAQELGQLTPAFAWSRYFVETGVPAVSSLNVTVPEFFRGMNQLLQTTELESLKSYLRWQTVHAAVAMLPKAFVDQDFAFYGKQLTGQQEIQARWKRCVRYTDGDLGEALGQSYVELTFGSEGKERMLTMVSALEKALQSDIGQLDWMTEATKKEALVKLHAMAGKIGYPNQWRDYSKLEIVRGDALGNSLRANAFEFQRQLNKIGKPVDRQEWLMSPPTVNAYYNAQMNDINFPAGILQPPFFSRDADDAVNYGGIGAVIGHEMTHGFDDEGSQFDEKGNLRNWWNEKDAREFKERTQCIAKEYAGFQPVPGVNLNGQLTLGENTADNGGVRIALMALLETLQGKDPVAVDGFTPEQRLFLGFGQIWCENQTEQSLRLRTQTDPHSPGRFRANGVVRNMPEFQKAFNCKPGSAMAPDQRCRVW